MKNTFKSSRKKNSSLYYHLLLFFLLIAIGASTLFYIWWPTKLDFTPTSKEIAEATNGLNLEELDTLPRINQRKIKQIEEKLANNVNPTLTTNAKNQIKNELNRIKRLGNNVNQLELKARLKKIDDMFLTLEMAKRQAKQQAWFTLSPQEEQEANDKIHELLTTFFERFREKILTEEPEKCTLKTIRPELVRKVKTNPHNYEEHVEHCKKWLKKKGIKDDTVKFYGFGGWLSEEEKAETAKKEGSSLLGFSTYTEHSAKIERFTEQEVPFYKTVTVCYVEHRPIIIKLLHDFLFSREGHYDVWITKFYEGGWNSIDISYEQVIQTMAHELAHSVLTSIMEDYDEYEKNNSGKGDGKGHGPLHTRYTREIEDMINNSSEEKAFKEWWNKKKANGKN